MIHKYFIFIFRVQTGKHEQVAITLMCVCYNNHQYQVHTRLVFGLCKRSKYVVVYILRLLVTRNSSSTLLTLIIIILPKLYSHLIYMAMRYIVRQHHRPRPLTKCPRQYNNTINIVIADTTSQ